MILKTSNKNNMKEKPKAPKIAKNKDQNTIQDEKLQANKNVKQTKKGRKFTCFTDASYNAQSVYKIGVVCVMIYENDQTLVQEKLIVNSGVASSYLQMMGIDYCKKRCKQLDKNSCATIYTDFKHGLTKNQPAKNIQIVKLKGHKPQKLLNDLQTKFKVCDMKSRRVRKELEKIIQIENY